MRTRGVMGGVSQRISSETVTLEYYDEYENGDGSATPIYSFTVSKASIGALQSRDIERLELAGIVIKDGVTIVLPFDHLETDEYTIVPLERPDAVIHNVDEYANVKYRVRQFSKANHITVLTCDLMPIQAANEE